MSDLDDFVLLRSDGRPTYNLAVVADDVAMEITHVVRGAGHLSNTHKQALLFDAFGAPRPVFAHLPTVLGPDGDVLSKRHGSQSAAHLRAEGYHPAGVLNYLSLLGWSSPDGREILGVDELARLVSLERLGGADTAVDPEKLRWVSAQHVAAMDLPELVDAVAPWLEGRGVAAADRTATVAALRSRLHTFAEIGDHLALLHPEPAALDEAADRLRADPDAGPVLAAARRSLGTLPGWEASALSAAVREAGKAAGVGGPRLFHPVRSALTATTSGPDLGLVLAALGRDESLRRLDRALPDGLTKTL